MLTEQEKTQLLSLASREGGWGGLAPQLVAAIRQQTIETLFTGLEAAGISITVADRSKVDLAFQNASIQCAGLMDRILDAALNAWSAHEDARLGPLLVLLAASVKGHLRG